MKVITKELFKTLIEGLNKNYSIEKVTVNCSLTKAVIKILYKENEEELKEAIKVIEKIETFYTGKILNDMEESHEKQIKRN